MFKKKSFMTFLIRFALAPTLIILLMSSLVISVKSFPNVFPNDVKVEIANVSNQILGENASVKLRLLNHGNNTIPKGAKLLLHINFQDYPDKGRLDSFPVWWCRSRGKKSCTHTLGPPMNKKVKISEEIKPKEKYEISLTISMDEDITPTLLVADTLQVKVYAHSKVLDKSSYSYPELDIKPGLADVKSLGVTGITTVVGKITKIPFLGLMVNYTRAKVEVCEKSLVKHVEAIYKANEAFLKALVKYRDSRKEKHLRIAAIAAADLTKAIIKLKADPNVSGCLGPPTTMSTPRLQLKILTKTVTYTLQGYKDISQIIIFIASYLHEFHKKYCILPNPPFIDLSCVMKPRRPLLAVTKPGYDDIGAILSQLGYEFTEIEEDINLDNYEFLKKFDAIFINCAENITEKNAQTAKESLKKFVKTGGTLYVSDWAFPYIEMSFPNYVGFPDQPKIGAGKQDITASIIDSGLRNYINQDVVDIYFNLPEWVVIDSVSRNTEVLMKGELETIEGTKLNKPLAISFNYGNGLVVYTSFHNEPNLKKVSQQLLEYLVLKPMTSQIAKILGSILRGTGFTVADEAIKTIDNQAELTFSYMLKETEDIKIALGWGGSELKLSVYRPDGTLFTEKSDKNPPVIITIPSAERGEWKYKVTAVEVPYNNYPIVVKIGFKKIEASWAMFQHDAQHTGRSPVEGPEKPVAKWAFNAGASITSSPAIATDGTMYVASTNKLYAISPNGDKKWEFSADSQIESSPAIGKDGTIYFGASPYIYAINPDGTEKWKFNTVESWDDVSGVMKSSPTIGPDGTIYIGSGAKVFAINPDGTEKWSFTTGSLVESAPAISEDGIIYVGSYDGKIYAINSNGTKKWEFQTRNWIQSSPAIGQDGTIYVTSGLTLYAINPDGSEKWEFLGGDLSLYSPALAKDGTIYVGAWDGNLYAINPDGSEKWEFSTRSGVTSSPILDGEGTIYVGSLDNNLYAVSSKGKKRWEFTIGTKIISSPAIGSDGTLYVGSNDGKLYAIGRQVPFGKAFQLRVKKVTGNGTKDWDQVTVRNIWKKFRNLQVDYLGEELKVCELCQLSSDIEFSFLNCWNYGMEHFQHDPNHKLAIFRCKGCDENYQMHNYQGEVRYKFKGDIEDPPKSPGWKNVECKYKEASDIVIVCRPI